MILKNGQILNDVTITDRGDTIFCEDSGHSYYINKNSVKSIIKTDNHAFQKKVHHWANSLSDLIYAKIKKHGHNYPPLIICSIACIAGITVFIFLLKLTLAIIGPWFAKLSKRRQLIRDITKLDENEKAVLREFIIQKQHVIEMPVEDKIVAGLLYKGILEKLNSNGEYSVRGLMLPLIMSSIADKYVNPLILGMPAALNDESRRELIESRPKFIIEMASFYKKLERKKTDYW